MPMFITGRVAITARGAIDEKDISPEIDIIFIHPKMSYGVQQQVIGAAARILVQEKKRGRAAPARGKDDAPDVNFDVGAHNIALLQHNILAWQGPSFVGVPCNFANIARLDADEPLVQQVLKEINARNTKRQAETTEERDDSDAEGDDPNVVTVTAVSTPAGA